MKVAKPIIKLEYGGQWPAAQAATTRINKDTLTIRVGAFEGEVKEL
jgi:hypothetical protein